MSLRAARISLAELIATKSGMHVTPYPPRQISTRKAAFFGAMSGRRETQDGGDLAIIPVIVVLPATTDDQYDALDDLIDGAGSIIDIIDEFGAMDACAASVDGDWSIEQVEVGGTTYLGYVVNVAVRY